MRPLFSDWASILTRIQRAKVCCLLLDYDGTLTPIVATPQDAVCPPKVKSLLAEIRESPHFEVAIISGRALEDIRDKVGIDGITYVGNHGLEFQNPAGECKRRLSAERQGEFNLIRQQLERVLSNIPGILFEDKGVTFSVHYRNVSQELLGSIPDILNRAIEKWSEHWYLRKGKMAFEVRPRAEFNKGKAAEIILKFAPERDLLPIALGDDDSDEDVFRMVRNWGITVSVGNERKNTEAEFYLKDPSEVAELLQRLAEYARPKHEKPEGPAKISGEIPEGRGQRTRSADSH